MKSQTCPEMLIIKIHHFVGSNFSAFDLLGLAAICATVFHDGAMNPIEGVSSYYYCIFIITVVIVCYFHKYLILRYW